MTTRFQAISTDRTPAQDAYLFLADQGWTARRIAAHYGVAARGVRRRLRMARERRASERLTES